MWGAPRGDAAWNRVTCTNRAKSRHQMFREKQTGKGHRKCDFVYINFKTQTESSATSRVMFPDTSAQSKSVKNSRGQCRWEMRAWFALGASKHELADLLVGKVYSSFDFLNTAAKVGGNISRCHSCAGRVAFGLSNTLLIWMWRDGGEGGINLFVSCYHQLA